MKIGLLVVFTLCLLFADTVLIAMGIFTGEYFIKSIVNGSPLDKMTGIASALLFVGILYAPVIGVGYVAFKK